jgi:hypothetical protein
MELARLRTDLPIFDMGPETPRTPEQLSPHREKVTLKFHKLQCVIPGRWSPIPQWSRPQKTILHSFSGRMKPGEFWALMGTLDQR